MVVAWSTVSPWNTCWACAGALLGPETQTGTYVEHDMTYWNFGKKKQLLLVWNARWFIARSWALKCIDWQPVWLTFPYLESMLQNNQKSSKAISNPPKKYSNLDKTIAAGWFLCTGFSWKQLWADSGFTFRGARRGHKICSSFCCDGSIHAFLRTNSINHYWHFWH